MFISAKIIAFIVKAEKAKSETQYTSPEQYTPKQPTITVDKLNNVLTSRTLHDLTYKLDPLKKNLSESPITTLSHMNAMIILSNYYNLRTLTHNELLNHQKQYRQHLKI